MKKFFISILLFLCLTFLYISGATQTLVRAETFDEFTAKSFFLMDYNTNQVLFEKNAETKMPVASIVKLMTICLVCEEIENGNISLDDKIIASENAAGMGGSQVFIETNGEYNIEDMLKSVIVSSANDASIALAETVAGSENNFVELMNKKAKELGLKNTNYTNSTGLPASGQFSCAKDSAILLKEVSKHKNYFKYSTIWMDSLKHSKGRESELVNTNKLIRYFKGCDGGKTGSTNEAGYCLAATAKRGDMRLIGVVLGAENGKTRFAETSQLLNFGFNNFENKLIVSKNKILENNIIVMSGKERTISVHPEKDIFVLSKKRVDNSEISTQVEIIDKIKAPVKKGESVGTVYVIKNGEVINQTNLVSCCKVDRAGFFDNITKIVEDWKVKTN